MVEKGREGEEEEEEGEEEERSRRRWWWWWWWWWWWCNGGRRGGAPSWSPWSRHADPRGVTPRSLPSREGSGRGKHRLVK